jgi:hypothetical protein
VKYFLTCLSYPIDFLSLLSTFDVH